MPNVISDTSGLIVLDNIDMIFILKALYGKIYLTEEVFHEFGKEVESWFEIQPVANKNYLKMLNTLIDLGEASTIALALEMEDSLMILDDLKARKVATQLNLKFTGLLGVILKAKQQGIIPSVSETLMRLKAVNFRMSPAIVQEVLKLAQEFD
jgi:predicted nucleic acid-binding protein